MYILIYKDRVVDINSKKFDVAEGFTWQKVTKADGIETGHVLKDGVFVSPEKTYIEKRVQAYSEKGWSNAFDVIDDILARGVVAVAKDKQEIKNIYKKDK